MDFIIWTQLAILLCLVTPQMKRKYSQRYSSHMQFSNISPIWNNHKPNQFTIFETRKSDHCHGEGFEIWPANYNQGQSIVPSTRLRSYRVRFQYYEINKTDVLTNCGCEKKPKQRHMYTATGNWNSHVVTGQSHSSSRQILSINLNANEPGTLLYHPPE